jgi:SAM-dependent methyltransferase
MPTAKELGLFCKYCNKEFGSNLEQQAHFKSEWHRTNTQLIKQGKPVLSLEKYVELFAKDIDITVIKDKDRLYWSTYYQLHKVNPPSSFADYVYNTYLSKKSDYCIRLVDIGCGNLRDTKFFLARGCSVIGIDNALNIKSDEITFLNEDVQDALHKLPAIQDVVYMRFFLHSLPYDKGEQAINLSLEVLKPGGLMCIEVRSNDVSNIPIKGVLKNGAYVTDHSRWLYTKERIQSILKSFEILELKEDKDFSITPKENPVLLRVIAKKPFINTYEVSKNYPLYKQVLSKQIDFARASYLDLIRFNTLVEQNSIQYTAVGGSILGLQRHGGIIPWDADIDLGLLEKDFTKLMALKHGYKIRINTKNKRYHLGTLDVVLLEDKGEWYEGEENMVCHKDEMKTLKKHAFGKTYIYAPTNSMKTLERKYGTDFNEMARIKGKEPFRLEPEDRNCV